MNVHAHLRNPTAACALRWAGRLLGLFLVLLVGSAVAIVAVIPRLTDGQAMTVLSGSMTPKIPVGSVVMVRPIDPARLHVGDIATYQAAQGQAVYITHRITAIKNVNGQTQFTFKGDANRGPDLKPVVPGQIRGKVWFHVPWLGRVRDDLKTGGFMLLAVILLIGYSVTQGVSGIRESRTREEANSVSA